MGTKIFQCDFSVSPSPFGLDFGTLDFRLWDLGLGLDNLIGRVGGIGIVSKDYCFT